MALTPQQQSELNDLIARRDRLAQARAEAGSGGIKGATAQTIVKAGEQAGWGSESALKRISELESFSAANKSPLEAAMQGVPELPKLQFSEMIRRRQVGTPEYNAQKATMALGEQRAQQAAQRQLLAAQAKSGVRGGAAAAQQQRMAEQGALQRAAAEQALVAKSQGEREKLSKQQQFGDLSSQLARMQMASAELGQQRGLQAAMDTAAAQRAAAAGAGGCCTIVAASTALLGIEPAEAAELVVASKTPGAQIEFKHPRAERFVLELNSARKIRDEWCSPREKRGYYKASEALARHVSGNKMAAFAVYTSWVKPVVACANGSAGFFTRTLVKGWIKVFDLLGGDKPFTRSNGEVV